MDEWTDEYIKEVQSKGVWTLVPAIYGPEGCEHNEIDNKEWYDKLAKEVKDEGDASIYGKGLVLGLVCQFDRPMVVGELRGQEKSLKFFYDLLSEIKDKTEALEKIKASGMNYCQDCSSYDCHCFVKNIARTVIDKYKETD